MTEPVTIAALAANPALCADVPAEHVPALLAQLASLQTALAARLMVAQAEADGPTRLLTVEEAAPRLGTTVDWLYRHAADFPFTRRISPKQLRFDEAGLARYLRDGRKAA